MNRKRLVGASVLVVLIPLCGCEAKSRAPPEPAQPPVRGEPRQLSRRGETPAPPASTPLIEVSEPAEAGDPATGERDAVLVVLGNEPLDDETPTVDMVARVAKAVEFHRENPSSLLVFTGGPTAGKTSEARMMAKIAASQGVPETAMRLEDKARSTTQNASLTARIIREVKPRRVLIVSKADHLEWAMPRFRRFPEFSGAEPLACEVDRAESIAQMEEYLKTHKSARVRTRLANLKRGVKGVD